jgi:hypothetical protein
MHIAIVQGHPKHLVNPHNLELIQGNCMWKAEEHYSEHIDSKKVERKVRSLLLEP